MSVIWIDGGHHQTQKPEGRDEYLGLGDGE